MVGGVRRQVLERDAVGRDEIGVLYGSGLVGVRGAVVHAGGGGVVGGPLDGGIGLRGGDHDVVDRQRAVTGSVMVTSPKVTSAWWRRGPRSPPARGARSRCSTPKARPRRPARSCSGRHSGRPRATPPAPSSCTCCRARRVGLVAANFVPPSPSSCSRPPEICWYQPRPPKGWPTHGWPKLVACPSHPTRMPAAGSRDGSRSRGRLREPGPRSGPALVPDVEQSIVTGFGHAHPSGVCSQWPSTTWTRSCRLPLDQSTSCGRVGVGPASLVTVNVYWLRSARVSTAVTSTVLGPSWRSL